MIPIIGHWARRPGRGTKFHLIESVIATDAITRCGRRLRHDAQHPLETVPVMPLTRLIGQPQLCRAGCQRGQERAEEVA